MKNVLAILFLLAVTCTVKYPSDCTIVNTNFVLNDGKYWAKVECSYNDGSRSTYWEKTPKAHGPRTYRVDYLPDTTLTDNITMTCQ